MDPLRTPPAVAACLTVIRESGADTATKTVVCHSIRLWAPAYHALRLTLSEATHVLGRDRGLRPSLSRRCLPSPKPLWRALRRLFVRCFISHGHAWKSPTCT